MPPKNVRTQSAVNEGEMYTNSYQSYRTNWKEKAAQNDITMSYMVNAILEL